MDRGGVILHSGRGRGSGGGSAPGVAEPLPPCALLSSNRKTTRTVSLGYLLLQHVVPSVGYNEVT